MRTWQTTTAGLLCGLLAASLASASPGDCTTRGDGNGDCRIGLDDVQDFLACMSGPGAGANPVCGCYDMDVDGDVDLPDFLALQAAFTGDALLPGCDLTPGAYEPGTRAIPPSIAGLEVVAPRGVGPIRWMAPESLHEKVYLFSGEVYCESVDLQIPGRGPDFVWARKYRSRVGPDTAQGVGWDYSYNVWIEASGGDLILHDGNTRADRYGAVSGPTGTTWCAPEFFREISQDPNGSYICRLANRSHWRFHPLDASPQEGKLVEIADTNGNALSFTYDGTGRLITITDTLSRPITVGYDGAGRIATVTDFTGRQVQYSYYGASDPDGSPGDLQSVRTPVVTGTPNGNDFPSGKTTTYTYSRGFTDDALNHNLLSITDPKGQTFQTSTYAATLDPNDADYDRVVRQTLGEPNDIIDYVYESQVPSASNGYAVRLTLVNDRNGHVSEHLYDKFNRCVAVRRLTGQAVADQPTSSSTNRPSGQLRPGDPAAYETRYVYNDDALVVRVTDPELSERTCVYEGDVNVFASPRARGNLLVCATDPGPRGGDQSSIEVRCEYDSLVNFDTNQVTRETDARGHDTLHAYDPAGNRVQTTHRIASIVEDFEYNTFGQQTAHVHPDNGSGHRRRDESTYYLNGPQTGYRESSIVDATGFALTTTYEYDAVGNVVRTIDPRGNDTLRIVNQLDQVVRILSRPADPNNPVRYETDTYYDENDNVVQIDVQNRDETGGLASNTHFTTVHEYDILDRCVRTTEEVDSGNSIITEFEYDSNSNRVLVRSGEATSGRAPTNTVTTLYDERDLVFQEIRAAGDPLQSSSQFDYDGNGNVVLQVDGLEGPPRVTAMTYDGYDRMTSCVNPTGNDAVRGYDANGNVVSTRIDGEQVDQPGGAANVRLFETVHVYDDMDRLVQTDAGHFDTATQSPIGDGTSSTVHVYSDSSQVVSTTDDNGNTNLTAYDTANRTSQTSDPKGNTRVYTYDDNSNVVRVLDTEKSDLGLADEVFQTDSVYDGLDRLVQQTDSSGNTQTCGFDSRDNPVVTVDALSNEVRCVYDGLNRPTTQTIDLDGDGADGDGADIVLIQSWDANSRPFLRVDDNGNATFIAFDPLNRPTFIIHPDNTSDTYTYDVHDNVLTRVDANGTTTTNSYDAANRCVGTTVAVGPGVSNDTTFETYTYDGLNRTVLASDDDSVVQRDYDSLSNVVTESLQGDVTAMTFDGMGNPLTCVYPSGRVLTYGYDSLNRLSSISEGPATIATYLYVGPDRVAFQQYGNGTRGLYSYDGIQGVPNPGGDFGVKRIVGITHSSGPTTVDARTFTWDAMYNKTERRDTRVGSPGLRHAYVYDDAYRLISGLQEDRLGLPVRLLNYNLDGVGNRNSVGGFGGVTGSYTLDPLDPPADLQVNQYTSTPLDGRQYDENGNLATVVLSPQQQIVHEYDCYDRLVARTNLGTGETAHYAYDAFGRRIGKSVNTAGCCECRYRYAGSSVIEELDPNGATLASYVRGVRASEIVCVESGGQIYYQHADDVGNVVALTDPNGAVFERYEYDDFGAPTITDGAGAPLSSSSVGNPYLFQGDRYDPETGWYLHGDRYYDPAHGRYITRPSGAWSDSSGHGNGFSAQGSNPWSTAPSDGHVTVLKGVHKPGGGATGATRRAAGPPHCPGCGAMLCRCTNATRADWRGHVTVLKARGHGGGATGQTRRRAAVDTGPPHCPGCGALLCRCTDSARSSSDDFKHKHRGHVTILKLAGKGGPPHCPGCGAMLCRCTGATRAAEETCPHRGHVTVLKVAGPGGPPHCPGCGAMLCRCKDSPVRDGGIRCKDCNMPPGHHRCILKIHQPGGSATGATRRRGMAGGPPHCPGCGAMLCRCTSASMRLAADLAGSGATGPARSNHDPKRCGKCRTCKHGTTYHKCKEDHTHILPAANNISSR